MNIYDLPIITDETMENKTTARIYENKIVCHPDLVEKVIDGMGLLRASAEGFEKDIKEMESEAGTTKKNDTN